MACGAAGMMMMVKTVGLTNGEPLVMACCRSEKAVSALFSPSACDPVLQNVAEQMLTALYFDTLKSTICTPLCPDYGVFTFRDISAIAFACFPPAHQATPRQTLSTLY